MKKSITTAKVLPFDSGSKFEDELTLILRQGARQMLQKAIESEVEDYINQHLDIVDERGLRLVVRNGHHPERDIQTGIGPISITKPKVGASNF